MTNSKEQLADRTNSVMRQLNLESVLLAASRDSICVGGSTVPGPVTPVLLDNDQLACHALVVDPDPAGVGRYALLDQVIAQQVARGGAVLIFDSEIHVKNVSHLRASLQRFARDFGRSDDLRAVDPFTPRLSHTYNVFFGSSADAAAEKALAMLPSAESNPGAEHYRNEATSAIRAIAGALKQAGIGYTPVDLAMFLAESAAVEELSREASKQFPGTAESVALEQLVNAWHGGDGVARYIKQVCGGMSGRLFMIGQGRLGRVFNTYQPQVTMRDVLDQQRLAIFQLPTGGMFDLSTLLRKMILVDFRRAVCERAGTNETVPPIVIFNGKDMLDAVAGNVFENLRQAGVSAWVATPSVAEANERILANTRTKFVFNLAGTREHEYLNKDLAANGSSGDCDDLGVRECALLGGMQIEQIICIPEIDSEDIEHDEFFGHTTAGDESQSRDENGASRFFRSFLMRDDVPA